MTVENDRSARLDERRRQAREWLVIRQPHRGLSAALEMKWERWATDAGNLAAYREYERVDGLLRALPRRPLPTDAELIDAQRRLHGSGASRQAPRARVAYFLAASAAVVLIGVLFGPRLFSGLLSGQPQVFQTTIGQQRTVTLRDHSELRLGGATRLSVLFSDEARRVTLYAGEVMLNVTHNPQVPFQVDVDATRVTALGTAFHVRRYTDQQMIVEVAQGAVIVSPREREVHNGPRDPSNNRLQSVTVKAGQEASADSMGQITPAHPTDFQAVAWWLYGRRVYREKPLGKVIEDLQLYFPRRIEYNRALDSLPFNGIIDPSKPEESIRGLEEVFPVEVDDSDPQRVIIRCRRPNCR